MKRIYEAIFQGGAQKCGPEQTPGRPTYSDHRGVDVPVQMLIEVVKATNGYVIKGCVPTDSGPDITEVRVVTADANLVEEMNALVMSLRMSGRSS